MTHGGSRNRRLACDKGVETSHAPPSPISDGDHSVQKQMRVKCFFAVLDPEGTAKLQGTKNTACLRSFSTVDRLKEHLWRAHSPTHNCPHCRGKTTKKPTKEFKALHARCQPDNSKISRPLPTLINKTQADALESLNQHFNKPNDEAVRCKKLWNALFPGKDFDEKRFVCSDGTAGVDGKRPAPSNNHTSSKSRKPGQQRKTPSTVAQNATPQTSPRASQGSKKAVNGSLFSVVKEPRGKTGVPQSTPSLDSGIGMGSGDDTSNNDNGGQGPSRRHSVDDGPVSSPIRGIGTGLETPKGVYPNRLQVGEDSTPPPGEGYGVRHNSPDMLSTPFVSSRTSSECTESNSGRSDTDMSQSDGSEGGEDDDEDSGIEEDESDIDMLDGHPISDPYEAVREINSRGIAGTARRGGNWDSDSDMGLDSDSDC